MRKFHKILGLTLLVPFIGWAITGFFFFIKPGYQQAYQSLAIKTYPISQALSVIPDKQWQEVRWVKTILGLHLLVKQDEKWFQLDRQTLQPVLTANTEQVTQLVNDAISDKLERYGQIISIDGLQVITNNKIAISLNWEQLKLSQSGTDTDFINRMYKIHYLQWTGIQVIDKVLGVVGLFLLMLLGLMGLRMAFSDKSRQSE